MLLLDLCQLLKIDQKRLRHTTLHLNSARSKIYFSSSKAKSLLWDYGDLDLVLLDYLEELHCVVILFIDYGIETDVL